MSEWTSVKDRLPAKSEKVLAFNGKMMAVCRFSPSSVADSHIFFIQVPYHIDKFDNVTYWMPLPETPKEDKFQSLVDESDFDPRN